MSPTESLRHTPTMPIFTVFKAGQVYSAWREARRRIGCIAALGLVLCVSVPVACAETQADTPLLQLGAGDSVAIHVYGQPDMDGTVYVDDDGTISVPLVGAVQVAGLAPADAAKRIEKALIDGRYLNSPHVTLTVTQSRSQRVAVLGEVRTPGRYQIESHATILEVLSLAGGTTENAGDEVYVMRAEPDGSVSRRVIKLRQATQSSSMDTDQLVRSGESVFVPRAEHFYIYGAVNNPSQYRLEDGMTVRQAIVRAGGVNARGSDSRIEITRKGKGSEEIVVSAKPGDLVQPNDVIKVKESLF